MHNVLAVYSHNETVCLTSEHQYNGFGRKTFRKDSVELYGILGTTMALQVHRHGPTETPFILK